MATWIPQRELRNNSGAVLARVEHGEELTVTVRGRPVADLVPTRERPGRPATGWDQFADRLHGLLAADDDLARDVEDGLGGLADDPFGDE
jgi:prevent-host-death family protein